MAGAAFHSIDKNKAVVPRVRLDCPAAARPGRRGTARRLYFQGTERLSAIHSGAPAGMSEWHSSWNGRSPELDG